MSKSTTRRAPRGRTADSESNDREDPRDIAEAASRPSMPRPDAVEVVDVVQVEQPAWVNKFHQDLTNVTETKIDERFNELQNKLCKRLGIAEQNITKLQSNQSISFDKIKVVEAMVQGNSNKVDKLQEELQAKDGQIRGLNAR